MIVAPHVTASRTHHRDRWPCGDERRDRRPPPAAHQQRLV